MKVYTNQQYEIMSIDNEPGGYKFVFEVDTTKEELFGTNCEAIITGYKYEPQYEFLFKEDGNHERNEETGELLYKLDDQGNKILSGYACYPFVDYNTLVLIQKQYEDSQKQLQAFNAQVAYISMMSNIDIEEV